jgi:hypothetical protein
MRWWAASTVAAWRRFCCRVLGHGPLETVARLETLFGRSVTEQCGRCGQIVTR